jgi:phosphoadenosine phosphosulfate reductase
LKWTLKEVEYYLENNVPQILYTSRVVSIVLNVLTISEDEDIRAGRWWWESSHKECGLHQK